MARGRKKNEIPSTRPQQYVRLNDAEVDAIDAAIRAQTGKEGPRSNYVREATLACTSVPHTSPTALVTRYLNLIRRPHFVDEQWRVICDACTDLQFGGMTGLYSIVGAVGRAVNQDRLHEPYGLEGAVLVQQVAALDYPHLCGVADVVERYRAGGEPTIADVKPFDMNPKPKETSNEKPQKTAPRRARRHRA